MAVKKDGHLLTWPNGQPHTKELFVPCNKCIGCRTAQRRTWTIRCLHEASQHQHNSFITLTYNDDHLPALGSLDGPVPNQKPGAFALFMKRFRKAIAPHTVRYFHAGEYGDCFGRPHYHALLFGWDFPDKTHWADRRNSPVYRSQLLERAWPFGHSEIGPVTHRTAAYVARYTIKKITAEPNNEWLDLETGETMVREAEYCTMSRNPGLGRTWIDRYMAEVYPADSVILNRQLAKPPRYYDGRYELIDPGGREQLRLARICKINDAENTPERLAARAAVALAQAKQKRG